MKNHPDTHGFWMNYKVRVAEKLPGMFIKKGELDRVMYCYINDVTVEECVEEMKAKRRQELLG